MKKKYLIVTVLFLFFHVGLTNLSAQQSRPTTTVNPKTGSPTASVLVDGLSVLSYSSAATEIGFLKDHHTGIIIDVYKQRECGIPVFPTIRLNRNDKAKIEINKSNPKDGGMFYQDGEKYDEDFLFMPDMCGKNWYQGVTLPHKPASLQKDHLSGKLVLKDAVFYTNLMLNGEGIKTNLDTGIKESIAKVGRILGADITCEPSDTAVIINITRDVGLPITRTLPKQQGPYYIVVRTEPMLEESHLHLLYDYIIALPRQYPEYDFKYKEKQLPWDVCNSRKQVRGQKRSKRVGRATEYACQTFGGCGGALPELW